jgi:serine/threonine-protein kinase PknK
LLDETVRLVAMSAEPIDEPLALRITSPGSQPLDGIGDVTGELMEDSQIRLLLVDGAPSALEMACQRARARVGHVDSDKRPRAHLKATIQLALCLAVAGDTDEAQRVLAPALKTCAALGLIQLLIDEGPQMVRLAKECITQADGGLADDALVATARDFALSLAEKPAP